MEFSRAGNATFMFDWLFTFEGWVSLATLTFLEIVLGIDNLVFVTVAARRLPRDQRGKAQKIGLAGALALRIAMLSGLVWLSRLQQPITTINGFALSWRDIIMLAGGLFLLWKATAEIHQEVENEAESHDDMKARSFLGAVFMIMIIDFVFALDSIVTAVGLTRFLPVMIAANVVAIGLMMVAARPIGAFIEAYPTVKMLALAFILLVGAVLVADGLHFHIPRGYVYFAIVFSLMVEGLNSLVRRNRSKGGK